MPRLQILPGNIADMIAAGEVVQRPASVVKELVENAVDAGASEVTVVITDAGRTLIQVIDNGCGMSPDDAVLCFERHATSKIATAEDLSAISTYGFRGEALASIAAVAEVCLKTRREGDETGTEVVMQASELKSRTECAAPKGCNFAVRNLFYNVPARRKFLKSDNVELKHIVEEFTRIALTRPEVGFSLSHNGHDIYVLKPAKSLKFRITDLLGGGVAAEVVDIHARTAVVNLDGFIGRPDTAEQVCYPEFQRLGLLENIYVVAVVTERESDLGARQGDARKLLHDVLQLDIVGLEELAARRDVIEEISDREIAALRGCALRAGLELGRLHDDFGAGFVLFAAGFQAHLGDSGDGREGLSAETVGADGGEVFGGGDFRRRVTLEAEHGVVRRHSAAVVDDLDERAAGICDDDGDFARAGVHCVLHQFLNHRRRPLDDLSGSYHIGNVAGKNLQSRHYRSE